MLCGSLHVLGGRYLVVYRVLAQMLFIVVAQATAANAFSCLSLLNNVVRVVSTETKMPDAGPPQIERKYAEIYLAVEALMASGGVLEANGALARAHASLGQQAEKSGTAAAAKSAEAPKTPQLTITYRGRRTINGHIQQLARMSFSIGNALRDVQPRPGFDLHDGASRPAGAAGQDPFAGLPLAGAASVAAASDPFGDDDFFGLGKGKPAAKPEAAAKAASEDPFALPGGKEWAAFDQDAAAAAPGAPAANGGAAGFEDNAFGDGKAGSSGFGDSAFGPPPVPKEPVLRLVEVWRGEVAGGKLVRAGLSGRVEWLGQEAKAQVRTVQFSLQAGGATEPVCQALCSARRHEATAKAGQQPGVFVADGVAAIQHGATPLLRYHVAPAFCRMPLQVHFGASWQAMHDGQMLVTVGLQYLVSPDASLQCGDLSVDVSVPALLEVPLRTSPGAAFDGQKRQLRWALKGGAGSAVAPGHSGSLAAAFVVSADEAALAPALRRMTAALALAGQSAGGSLSGVGLAQGVLELEATPQRASWSASMTATLGL